MYLILIRRRVKCVNKMNSRWVLIRLHITSCVEVNIVLKDLDLMRNSILNGESPNKTEFKVLKYWTVKIFCLGQSLNINSQLVFFFLFLNWSLSLKTSSVLEFNQMDQFHCSWLGAETFITLTVKHRLPWKQWKKSTAGVKMSRKQTPDTQLESDELSSKAVVTF